MRIRTEELMAIKIAMSILKQAAGLTERDKVYVERAVNAISNIEDRHDIENAKQAELMRRRRAS